MKNTYLATVNKDFELTDAFKEKLEHHGIELLDYRKNLNVLKLAADKDITSLDLKPLTHIEPDQKMTALRTEKDQDKS